jgi:hypothetical protein
MKVRLPHYGTDRTAPNNQPYSIIRYDTRGTGVLIDVVIPGDRNVIKKGADNSLKHKYLIIEILRMCNVKAKVIPVIRGGGTKLFQNDSDST